MIRTDRFALAALIAVAVLAPATAAAAPVTCHGERADVVGTERNDRLRPGDIDRGDVIALLGGNDEAEVGAGIGRVTVCGGDDRDELVANPQAARFVKFLGGPGHDFLGSESLDRRDVAARFGIQMAGGAGDDALYGGLKDDRISGGSGDDVIRSYGGNDLDKGGAGNDAVEGGPGDDLIWGGHGDDALFGYFFHGRTPDAERSDIANGGPGHDRCRAAREHSCERTHHPPRLSPLQ
jgi:Ca2+-binding RTX toxin-like protein